MTESMNPVPSLLPIGPASTGSKGLGTGTQTSSGNDFGEVFAAQQSAQQAAGQPEPQTASVPSDAAPVPQSAAEVAADHQDDAESDATAVPLDPPARDNSIAVAQAQAAAVASAGLSGPPAVPVTTATAEMPELSAVQEITAAGTALSPVPAQPLESLTQARDVVKAAAAAETEPAASRAPLAPPANQTPGQAQISEPVATLPVSALSVPDPGAVRTTAAADIPAARIPAIGPEQATQAPAPATVPATPQDPAPAPPAANTAPAASASLAAPAASASLAATASTASPASPAAAAAPGVAIDPGSGNQAPQPALDQTRYHPRLLLQAGPPNSVAAPQFQSATVAAAVQGLTGTGASTGISLVRQRTPSAKETAVSSGNPATLGAAASTASAFAVPVPSTAQVGPTVPAEPDAMPQAVFSQVIDHLVKQHLITARNLRDGTHQAIIQLNPDNLGQVTVTLDVSAGRVRLDLAAGQQALTALGSDLGQLRSGLADAGMNLTGVTLSTQTADSGAGQPPPRRDGQLAATASNSSQDGQTATPTRRTAPELATGQGRPAASRSLDLLA